MSRRRRVLARRAPGVLYSAEVGATVPDVEERIRMRKMVSGVVMSCLVVSGFVVGTLSLGATTGCDSAGSSSAAPRTSVSTRPTMSNANSARPLTSGGSSAGLGAPTMSAAPMVPASSAPTVAASSSSTAPPWASASASGSGSAGPAMKSH